jgi:flagellin-like protein
MSRKGVSAVIATILLLMITIALAGTAYVYMTNLLKNRTSKTITLLDASCTGNLITLVISNDGALTIDGNNDIQIFVGSTRNDTFVLADIEPHNAEVTNVAGSAGPNNVLVVSPSNSVRQTIYC